MIERFVGTVIVAAVAVLIIWVSASVSLAVARLVLAP